MGVTLADDQLRDLLTDLPQSYKTIQIRGEISSKLNNLITDYDFIVDSWPDFRAVVARVNPVKARNPIPRFLRNLVLVYASDNRALETLLQEPGILDWSARIEFKTVDKQTSLAVLNAVQHKGKTFGIRETFYFTATKDTIIVSPVPKGFRLTSLQPEQAHLVNSAWALQQGEDSEAYIRCMINKLPSCCLYNQEGDVVGFGVSYHYPSVGMLYVYEEHRGKGYAKVIMSQLSLLRLQAEKEMFSMSMQVNTASIKLHESVGFCRVSEPHFREVVIEKDPR